VAEALVGEEQVEVGKGYLRSEEWELGIGN
jgi:hypothetical protein